MKIAEMAGALFVGIFTLGIVVFFGGIIAMVVTSVDVSSWSLPAKVALGGATATIISTVGICIFGDEL